MTATQISVEPLYLNDIVFATADSSYEKAIAAAAFTPSSKTVTFQGGTPDSSFTFPGPTTWTCDLTYAQDWETTGSLSNFLHSHEGESFPVTFTPKTGGGTWSATITVAPGAIGGNIGDVNTSKVSLGVSGRPVWTPAA